MGKCIVCGKESGKGRTCGSTCRSRLRRSVAKEDATVANATVSATPDATVKVSVPRSTATLSLDSDMTDVHRVDQYILSNPDVEIHYVPEERRGSKPAEQQSVTFKPECVTCDEMVEGDNGAAACDVGGCEQPVTGALTKERQLSRHGFNT